MPSEQIDENQVENNQYSHLVWRHDMDAKQFVSVAGYFRHSRATFTTDPYNVLAYTRGHEHEDEGENGHEGEHEGHDEHGHEEEMFSASAGHQDRWGYAGGIRLDYTHAFNSRHMIKAGFQIDRTTTRNKTRLFAFAREEHHDDHDMHDDHDDHDMHDDHDDHDMHDDHDDHDMHDDHDDHDMHDDHDDHDMHDDHDDHDMHDDHDDHDMHA